jgi:hypothetical protein
LIEIKDQIGRIDVNVGAARKTSREARSHSMEAQNPFEAVRTVMLDNLEKMGGATQRYLDAVETTMRGFPGANQEQIGAFKAYIERQVAVNRDFAEKLLRAHDFQEAFRIQVEYFQSQLRAATEDASQLGAKMADSFKRAG